MKGVMLYGVYLDLDASGRQAIDRLSGGIQNLGSDIFMPARHGHSYHLTLAVFERLDMPGLTRALAAMASGMTAPRIAFSGLAIFPGERSVLFAAPYMTPELMAVHARFHRLAADCLLGAHRYAPDRWAPHVTFAMNLDPDQLGTAARLAAQRWQAIECRLDTLRLVALDTAETLWSEKLADR